MSRSYFIDTFSSNFQFFIPVYQRNYDWKVENCEQLVADIAALAKKVQEKGERCLATHFLSCIVTLKDIRDRVIIIIDGQQRLTTIALLLLAIYNASKEYIKTHEEEKERYLILIDEIYRFLFTSSKKSKIILKEGDRDAFECLLNQKEVDNNIKATNIYVNYQYFFTTIQKYFIEEIDKFYNAITRLTYIEYELDQEDNPQEVFESLNSTGVDLTDGDKIRNYILMNQSLDDQADLYNNYWSKIERYALQELPNFFRYYLTIKTKKLVTLSKVYSEFKSYIKNNPIQDIEQILQEITRYAKYYAILKENQILQDDILSDLNISPKIRNCISRINYIKRSVTLPFLMSVLGLYENQCFNLHDLEEIFTITETYIYREIVCDLKTDNKLFALIHNTIFNLEDNYDNYLEKYKHTLLTKTDALRWPSDQEFEEKFVENPIGLTSKEIIVYTFDRLENYLNNGAGSSFIAQEKSDEDDLNVEHIIPKILNEKWQETLGKNSKTIRTNWYNKLANLTLTNTKSRASLSFTERLDLLKEKDPDCLEFGINNYIKKQNTWTEKQLKARSDIFKKAATQIWKNISTTYVPSQKMEPFITLDDEFDVTGYQLTKFCFYDKYFAQMNWNSFFKSILEELYSQEKYKYKFLHFVNNSKVYWIRNDISQVSYKRYFFKLADNIYVHYNTRAQLKINYIKQIFDALDIPVEALHLFVKKKAE